MVHYSAQTPCRRRQLHSLWVGGLALLLLGCKTEGRGGLSTEVEPRAPQDAQVQPHSSTDTGGERRESAVATPIVPENTASALQGSADSIAGIDLVDRADFRLRGQLSGPQREALLTGLSSSEVSSSYAATPPPFPFALRIHVEGQASVYIAHPVAMDFLRLNPAEPWSVAPGPPAKDLFIGTGLFDALVEDYKDEVSKEYGYSPDDELMRLIFEEDSE